MLKGDPGTWSIGYFINATTTELSIKLSVEQVTRVGGSDSQSDHTTVGWADDLMGHRRPRTVIPFVDKGHHQGILATLTDKGRNSLVFTGSSYREILSAIFITGILAVPT